MHTCAAYRKTNENDRETEVLIDGQNISAQKETTQSGAWLQKENGYRKRQKGSQEKTRERQSKTLLLIANEYKETVENRRERTALNSIFYFSFSNNFYRSKPKAIGRFHRGEGVVGIMKCTAIRENHLYAKTYKKGKKYVGRYIVVYVLRDLRANAIRKARPDKTFVNRVGLTVTKKTGGAVQRNRCKRVLREAYRQTAARMGTKGGNLVVIVARDALRQAKTQQVLPDMERAFSLLRI